MSSNPLAARWLIGLLASVGASHAEVAATLARAHVTGFRNDVHDCPLARFVAAKARALVPAPAELSVTVTVSSVAIGVTPPSSGTPDEVEVLTSNPVATFLRMFDAGEYPTLDAALKPRAAQGRPAR